MMNQNDNFDSNYNSYLSIEKDNEQLKNVLKEEDFIKIEQVNENLKRLYVAGEIFAENGFYQRSDQRVKEHIKPLQNCLENILNLTGKSFKYKGKDELKLGFIAQEVQKVYPELITEDEIGLSVDVIGLIPVIVEALKEINDFTKSIKDESNYQIDELSKASENALKIVRNIHNELEIEKAKNKKEEYNFSMGPAVLSLLGGSFLTLISCYVVYSLSKLPGIWVYCWVLTIVVWTSCWRQRNELTESIKKRELIIYWKKENTLSCYIFLFLGLLTLGISIIMGGS